VTSVIHDIGYQRYEGPRLGRGYATRSLFVHSLRTAYGLGRTAKAKVFPWLVAGIVGIVAVVLTAVRAAAGPRPLSYLEFADTLFVLVILFCAVVAPELVSRDLRNSTLPLYFSRPIRRTDYALAKLAALVAAAWLLLAGPELVMYVGGVFTVDGWSAIWAETEDLAGGLTYAGIHAVVTGSIAVLIASMIGRRAIAAGAIVAAFLVTTPVVGILSEAGGETGRRLAGLFSPSTLIYATHAWFDETGEAYPGDLGWLYGATTLGLVVACVGLLLLRYRRVQS
jgi:ABC-2 type transport system permease protein